MELKEYFLIIKKQFKLFLAIFGLIVVTGLVYVFFRPVSFDTSLTLNITRSGAQVSDNYEYDDFYRLQADEKFAETIVEWLKSPRTEEDIYVNSGIDVSDYSLKKLMSSIVAEKRSAQLVAVSFSVPSEALAKSLASSVSKVISQNIAKLNQDQKEATWFEIVSGDSVTRVREVNPVAVVVIFCSAIFLAFFGILFKHYLE
ncbi:MAG: hypothetical protein WA064_00520 [Candidatus Moraniibacteriota bacterium]